MIEKYLLAILNALLVLHNENKTIAKRLSQSPDAIDETWDAMFFGALKDLIQTDGKGDGDADNQSGVDEGAQPEQV